MAGRHRIGIFVVLVAWLCEVSGAVARPTPNMVTLGEGWRIQSSALTSKDGAMISSNGLDMAGWHAAAVPETVLSALVKDGTYTNIYFSTNLATIPTEPFTNAWWYRTEFETSHQAADGNATLTFDGINYRANIWLNGRQIASQEDTFGAYRIFRFDVSRILKTGKNVLAVEVFPPKPGDFAMGFVDWNPKPPDRDMGLFRPVTLHFYKTVEVNHVFIESKINHDNWKEAALTVCADLVNHADHPVETTLNGSIGDIQFSEKFALAAGESRTVKLMPETHPELKLAEAKLWWPWELGEPNLYTLDLSAEMDGKVADQRETRFGIREAADYINPQGYRGYKVNGRPILIRGGGWADELLLDEQPDKLKAQIAYTRAMNLNTIRLEGVWGSSQWLYDLADENGLLIMVGWSCQWEWKDYLGKKCDKFGGFITPAEMQLATNYLHDQVLWLRNHPSIFVWVLGSDMLPRPALEKNYDLLLAQMDPTRPTLKTCGDGVSSVSGPSAVKMNGPYDYVTPNYWYLDSSNGGAFGFNTETGPGPQPPPLETLKRMFPADKLWPINEVWNFHAGRNEFNDIKRYMNAYNQRYGEARSAEEFAFKSQAANYEAIRAMYEAFGVNVPKTTGLIQWMLNASWPKLYWQLYDYYLMPGGAYFGVKKGAAPTGIVYNYGDEGIYVVNETGAAQPGCRAMVTIYDLDSRKIFSTNVVTSGPAFGSVKVLDFSNLSPATPVYFMDLELRDGAGKKLADNFYWLSTKPDVLDEDKTEWYVTPNKSFADFTALDKLPKTMVIPTVVYKTEKDGNDATVTLENRGDTMAFFIEMEIADAKSHTALLPVLWDDNYVSLPPHTSKTFHAHVPNGGRPELKLQGWNSEFVFTKP